MWQRNTVTKKSVFKRTIGTHSYFVLSSVSPTKISFPTHTYSNLFVTTCRVSRYQTCYLIPMSWINFYYINIEYTLLIRTFRLNSGQNREEQNKNKLRLIMAVPKNNYHNFLNLNEKHKNIKQKHYKPMTSHGQLNF